MFNILYHLIFFYLVLTWYFSIENSWFKIFDRRKTFKIVTCFAQTKQNLKIALGILFTKWFTIYAFEGIGVRRRVKKKNFHFP